MLCRRGMLQIEKSLANFKKPYTLVPVRFVEEGGTKIGHTVIMNWEAKVSSESERTLVASDR